MIVEMMDGKELVLPDACETQKDRLEVYSWLCIVAAFPFAGYGIPEI